MNEQRPFDWVIAERRSWPPGRRPAPPFGPTTIEVVRSCPLRACFEASPGYERRQGFASRIGTAFHRALRSLTERPPRAASLEAASYEAARRFDDQLRDQEAQAARRPRERHLPKDQGRIERAREAVIVEGQRLWREAAARLSTPAGAQPVLRGDRSAEVEVRSADGLFVGQIDRVECASRGIRLVDYKSAVRADLPARYERQLQLYAWLWHDVHGAWPAEATVVYPFLGERRAVPVDPPTCERVVDEAAEVLAGLYLEPSFDRLATPGDVCKVCEFRPWCRPFWRWQGQERERATAWNRAELGLEGTIERVRRTAGWQQLWLRWRDVVVQLNAPLDRFPQLAHAGHGRRLRLLEARLTGSRQHPQATTTDYTEVFLMQAEGDDS